MYLIKLSATSSTNDYLKNLISSQSVKNFVVVVADIQTQGKGQRGNVWSTEPFKNLTFSVLVKDVLNHNSSVFDLNTAVSVSIVQALLEFKVPNLTIKWPNDILSDNKKISGILIENTFTNHNSIQSVVGIGVNVNQSDFTQFPKASSIKNILNKEIDKEALMIEIIKKIKENCSLISEGKIQMIWQTYHNLLFRKEVPSVFEYPNGQKFMGIIKQVLKNGKIQIMLEDDSLKEFDLKEISLIY